MPDAEYFEALQKAVREEWTAIVSIVRYRLRVPKADAEDCVQQAILRVLEQMRTGAAIGPVRSWRAYLITCAVHEGYRARKLKRERREVAFDELTLPVVALNRTKHRRAA